jgi:hypothetical protein
MLPRPVRALALFGALSVADLTLTYLLLRESAGEVYEANWLAAWVLANYGYAGLSAFKGLVMLLAGALVSIVWYFRPNAARRLATFACAAVGFVVAYSAVLWARLDPDPRGWCQLDPANIAKANDKVARGLRQSAEFKAFLGKWAAALAAGRCTMEDAVVGLGTAELARDHGFLEGARDSLGVQSEAAILATLVVRDALYILMEDVAPPDRARAATLLAIYQAAHGTILPANDNGFGEIVRAIMGDVAVRSDTNDAELPTLPRPASASAASEQAAAATPANPGARRRGLASRLRPGSMTRPQIKRRYRV